MNLSPKPVQATIHVPRWAVDGSGDTLDIDEQWTANQVASIRAEWEWQFDAPVAEGPRLDDVFASPSVHPAAGPRYTALFKGKIERTE